MMSDADGDEGAAADAGAVMDDASDAGADACAAAVAMLPVMLMLLPVVTLAELLAAHAHAVAQHINNCPTPFVTHAPLCVVDTRLALPCFPVSQVRHARDRVFILRHPGPPLGLSC